MYREQPKTGELTEDKKTNQKLKKSQSNEQYMTRGRFCCSILGENTVAKEL